MPHFTTQATQALSGLAWLTLVHSVWIGLLAGAIAGLWAAILRPSSHGRRRAVYLVALSAIVAGSPAAAIVHRLAASGPPPAISYRTTIRPAPEEATPAEADADLVPPMAPAHPVATVGWPARFRGFFAGTSRIVTSARTPVMAGWSVGVSANVVVLLVGAWRLRRYRREARPAPDLAPRAGDMSRSLGLRRVPAILSHSDAPEPFLAGVLRPVIFLPARWLRTADVDAIDAVLAHELSHARRLDHLANLAQRAVEACFFFHPCVRHLSRSARREAEYCADASAARLTGNSLALARALESVARLGPTSSRPSRLGLALGGERRNLLPRIQELLGMTPTQSPLPRWPFAAIPAALLVAAVSSSVVLAQATPTQAEAPAARPEGPALAAPYVPDVPPERFREIMRSDPRTLSHEDLVRRVRGSGLGDDRIGELDREKLLELATAVQISFEVLFLEVDDEDWKAATRDRLTPLKLLQENEKQVVLVGAAPPDGVADEGWMAKEADLDAIRKQLLRGKRSRPVAAPKVTTFEGAQATIMTGNAPLTIPPKADSKRSGVTISQPGSEAPGNSRSTTKFETSFLCQAVPMKAGERSDKSIFEWALNGTIAVGLTGTRLEAAHRIETTVLSKYAKEYRTNGDEGEASSLEAVVTRRSSFDIPDGHGYVFNTGLTFWLSDGDERRTVRNLILVTPRHIVTEEEEARLMMKKDADVAKASAATAK